MRQLSKRTQDIHAFILDNVKKHPKDVAKLTSTHFNISRQAVNKHIQALVESGHLRTEGYGSGLHYFPNQIQPEVQALNKTFEFPLVPSLSEDMIWRDEIKPLLTDLPKNILDLWGYSFTEMVNNAIDHSGGSVLTVYFQKSVSNVTIWVCDNGEGIFNKIQRELHLHDPRQALFELKKGKLTTDRERHSGQGIFFTSRMCDRFVILSDNLAFLHNDQDELDWLSKQEKQTDGTSVYLEISNTTNRTAKEIFDQYASDGDAYEFSKTIVPVQMAAEGEGLISRSQAKRLMIRVDKFETVILDFSGVEQIGQGFADEIFRVYARQHHHVRLFPVNTNEAVSSMITRALLTRTEDL